MKDTLIIYDSVFGNTGKIANEIARIFREHMEVDIRQVGEVWPEHLDGIKLLIVGSPTRQFKATAALDQFLNQIPDGSLQGIQIAAFDTRMTPEDVKKNWFLAIMVKLFGYAAEKIAKQLKKLGGIELISPQGFLVSAIEGPLVNGELESVAIWVNQILELQKSE
jgi:flavodoxin